MQDYFPASAQGKGVLSAAILGSAAVFLSSGGVSVALPSIQSSFGSNLSGLQWVVNAQLITLAALLPIGGSVGDRFGRRRVFVIGILIFAAASLISALPATLANSRHSNRPKASGRHLWSPKASPSLTSLLPNESEDE